MVESFSSQLQKPFGQKPFGPKNAELTQASFDHLLSCLGPDRDRAAAVYVELRRALFTYFALRGAASPDELTDETFDRVARRLAEGQSIFTESPANYFFGVARNVWRESLARANVISQLPDESPRLVTSATPQEVMLESLETRELDRRLVCLQKCLELFSAEDRDLIVGYYRDIGGAKIENRKALALRFGQSLDSLRHRVARLKLKLASCVGRCVKTQPPS